MTYDMNIIYRDLIVRHGTTETVCQIKILNKLYPTFLLFNCQVFFLTSDLILMLENVGDEVTTLKTHEKLKSINYYHM